MANEAIEELRKSMQAAQPSGRGQYLDQGRHELEIDKAFVKRTTFEGKTKESWIVEFKVISSTNPSHEVGSTRSYVENPNNDGWMGRFKAFLVAVAGIPGAQKLNPQDEQLISDITVALRYDEYRVERQWPENFLKGRRVLCEGMPGKSRNNTPITNKKWEPILAPAAPAPPAA